MFRNVTLHGILVPLRLAAIGALLTVQPLTAKANVVNTSVGISPTSVSIGQTVTLKSSFKASVAVANAIVHMEVRPLTAAGAVGTTAIFKHQYRSQTFKAAEVKSYSVPFKVPAGTAGGRYTYLLKTVSGDGKTVFQTVAKNSGAYVFTINAPPATATPKPTPVPAKPTPVAQTPFLRGVNIMDLGIGHKDELGVFGRNYTMTSAENFKNLARRGHKLVRLTIHWERIQPKLGGPLDSVYLGRLLQNLRDTDAAGMKAIVDLHNYARYHIPVANSTKRTETILGDLIAPVGPRTDQYTDLWKKLSNAIRKDPVAYRATWAYDLMNEPHDIPDVYASFTRKASIATYESGLDGWQVSSGQPITAARVLRSGQYSLRISVPIKERKATDIYSMVVYKAQKAILEGNGNVIQVKGHIPDATEGNVQMRFYLVDGAHKMHVTGAEVFRKGRHQVNFNVPLPAAGLKGTTQLIMQVLVSGTKGETKSPQYVYIDEINQGTAGATTRGKDVWVRFAQAAVNAIRDVGDNKMIHVEGYAWASAARWPSIYPKKFITDRANNIMYHAHQYLDSSAAGAYKTSFAEETAIAKREGHASVGARGVWRLKQFIEWCEREKVRCFIGEYGWPNSAWSNTAEARQWDVAGEQFLKYLDSKRIGATAWATGSWLTADGNPLNTYVLQTPTRSFQPTSLGLVIERYPSR